MTKDDIIRALKEQHLGAAYEQWDVEMRVRKTVKDLLTPLSPNLSFYQVSTWPDHSTHKIILRDSETRNTSPVGTVIVKKKKGETHRGRFGGSWTEYTIADFEVILATATAEDAIEHAISEIIEENKADHESREMTVNEAKKVMKLFGWADPWRLKMWADKINQNYYEIKEELK